MTEEWRLKVYGRALGGSNHRTRPREAIKAEIRKRQAGRCLYCDMIIGSQVWRRGSQVTLRTAWDHFIPHAYLARSPHDNWVLACHVCNQIKNGRLYADVTEAREYIRVRRIALGYEAPTLGDLLPRESVMEEQT